MSALVGCSLLARVVVNEVALSQDSSQIRLWAIFLSASVACGGMQPGKCVSAACMAAATSNTPLMHIFGHLHPCGNLSPDYFCCMALVQAA